MSIFIRPCEGRRTSPFGWRVHPIQNKRIFHQGVDLAKPGNVPILAAADGTVTRSSWLGTYGNVIFIVHYIGGRTYETVYAHLHSSIVKVGQKVKQGQRIARMGTTGGSTGQHLHFEVHHGRWLTGQPNVVNPAIYIDTYAVAKYGERGPGIRKIQEKLNGLGYKLSTDGVFGKGTDSAVRDFQRKNKLVVDGQAGPATLRALDKPITATPKPVVPEKPKEEIKLFKPTTGVLNDSAIKFLEGALEEGTLHSDEWSKKAKQGTLTESDMTALYIHVSEARRGKFRPTTPTLKSSLYTFIEVALENKLLLDDDWLELARSGSITNDDVAAIHLEVANRMIRREKESEEIEEVKEDK